MKTTFRNSLGAALCLSLPLSAQVNITGKVTDHLGAGVAGATVTLKKQKLATVTGVDGSYTLNASSGLVRLDGKGPAALAFRNGRLEFQVQDERAAVRIEAFDPAGKSSAVLLNGELPKGAYHVDPFASAGETQLRLLRIRIGAESFSLKMLRTGDGRAQASALDRSSLSSAALAKASADILDTVVVTKAGYDPGRKKVDALTGTVNVMIMQPDVFWGNPADYPAAKNVMTYVFLNRTNGKYRDDQIFWTFNNQTKTIAEQHVFDMPANSSGRVTFHLESANGKYWDFMEHTITAGTTNRWYGNTTRVDAYGLPMAIRLICADGTDSKMGENYDVFYMGRDKFFQLYKASVPEEFQHNADNGAPYRILAPGKGDGAAAKNGFDVGEKYATYFDAYLKEVNVTGATTKQAFACEGNPFGQNAQLAGAVNRHVAHLPKSEWSKPENYYKQAPANFYAKFLHDVSFGEKSYGFAYDDAEGQAAYTECGKPKTLIIAVGF
jgi:hypothetical protein